MWTPQACGKLVTAHTPFLSFNISLVFFLPFKGRVGVGMGESCDMKGQTNEKILKPRLQRRLRKNLTDAEQRLWTCLRRRQMAHFKFRRQHPFGDYVIDFVCLEAMLAV